MNVYCNVMYCVIICLAFCYIGNVFENNAHVCI